MGQREEGRILKTVHTETQVGGLPNHAFPSWAVPVLAHSFFFFSCLSKGCCIMLPKAANSKNFISGWTCVAVTFENLNHLYVEFLVSLPQGELTKLIWGCPRGLLTFSRGRTDYCGDSLWLALFRQSDLSQPTLFPQTLHKTVFSFIGFFPL